MSRIYDNWEKLVDAVLRREKDRHLALCLSFNSSSSSDLSSRFSLSSNPFVEDAQRLSFLYGTNGEFEVICKAFGFSGIDDFAISPEEYEAMKVESSSSSSSSSSGVTDKLSVRSKIVHRNGIKGDWPTIVGPTWDTSEGFLVDRDPCIPKVQSRFCSNKEECEVVGWDRSEQEKDMRVMAMIREENGALSDSCSFSSNEDDFSSLMTEPSISSNERYGRVINDWQKGELLGRGRFGSVYEGISDDGFFFAVKEVSLLDHKDEGEQYIIQLEQEIGLLTQFEHENIVQYYDTAKDELHLYIFLELVTKGSLLTLYRKYHLRVMQVSVYTRQILHGLKYLHDRNVIHRDIKCANVLVDINGSVKLADFGLAKAAQLNDVRSCVGSICWMAPEVVMRRKDYGLAADIWSLGCTVLEMLTGRFPYFGFECMQVLFKIGRGERPAIPDTLTSDARHFILQCLQADPSLRPTAAQLLDHPFVQLRDLSSWRSIHGVRVLKN